MPNLILNYNTTPSVIDLTGARPGVDWKGNKSLEICARRVFESGIDWKKQHGMKFKEWTLVPDETIVSRIYFQVFIYDKLGQAHQYGTYESYDFPDAIARQMADDKSWSIDGTNLFIQLCCSLIYPNGSSDDCYVMAGISLLDPKWNVCEVGINWRADHNIDCNTRRFARPWTDACNNYPELAAGKPLSINGLTGCEIFSDPIVVDYNDEGLTFRYGSDEHTIKVGQPFKSNDTGKNYTTFNMTISLKNDE